MVTISPEVTPYYGGGQVVNPANVIKTVGAPSVNIKARLGTIAVDNAAATVYMLASKSGNTDTWVTVGGASSVVDTLSGDSGGNISPTGGNIKLAGTANQITSAGSGSTITFSLIGPYTPATYTAHGVLVGEGTGPIVATAAGATGQGLMGSTGADPGWTGSPSFTGTVTGGTGIVATTGGLTATAGGLTVTAGGAGITGTTNINTTGAAVTSINTGGTGALNLGNATGNTAITGSLTASTTLTATSGAITATNGNLVLGTAGNKLSITTGANASVGTSVAMSGTPGAVTVSTTAVTASSIIFVTRNTVGGTLGQLSVPTASITAGTSFVINSNANETSTINWWIVN